MHEKFLKRDDLGLVENLEYFFKEDGFVDWWAMTDEKYLYPKQNAEKKDNIKDYTRDELIVRIPGLIHLAKLRGYTRVRHFVQSVSEDYAATTCLIRWIPNYETGFESVEFEALACAHKKNTEGFSQDYLIEIAQNRSFGRCVRNFLGIESVCDMELSETQLDGYEAVKEINTLPKPHETLQKLMEQKNKGIDYINNLLRKQNIDAVEFIDNIPVNKVYGLIEKVKRSKKKTS